MNTFNKALFSTAAALFATQAEAKGIHNSCLRLSDTVAGDEDGEFFTNEDQLTQPGFSDDMRLHSITTCHDDGDVYGIQFHMSKNPYEGVDDEIIALDPIGVMEKPEAVGSDWSEFECEVLELPQGLDRIKVTLKSTDSGVDIQYRANDGDFKKTIGWVRLIDFEDWDFSEANPLIGMWGRQTSLGIAQLSFITLDT